MVWGLICATWNWRDDTAYVRMQTYMYNHVRILYNIYIHQIGTWFIHIYICRYALRFHVPQFAKFKLNACPTWLGYPYVFDAPFHVFLQPLPTELPRMVFRWLHGWSPGEPWLDGHSVASAGQRAGRGDGRKWLKICRCPRRVGRNQVVFHTPLYELLGFARPFLK